MGSSVAERLTTFFRCGGVMPRPVKTAERYKRQFALLTAERPCDDLAWIKLLSELQGLCEALDQTTERLYRLERCVLQWSDGSVPAGGRGFENLPAVDGVGDAVKRLHDAIDRPGTDAATNSVRDE